MSTTIEPLVQRTRDARGVVTLTLNRPQAFNSLSEGMLAALQQALDGIAEDEGARVVVLAATGKAFCAGHDLKEMRAAPSLGYYERLFAQCGAMMMSIQGLSVPVIARVQGIATAAGCQLVAMCDLAVAASDARFAVSGVNLGLFCSTPSVALSRNVQRKAAFEMLVTGEFISATQALERGLVNRVASPDRLDAEVEALVASIVAKPRVAIALGKQLFYRQLESGIEAAYDDAARTMACNMMDGSALEGVQAFIEKRAPDWAPRDTDGLLIGGPADGAVLSRAQPHAQVGDRLWANLDGVPDDPSFVRPDQGTPEVRDWFDDSPAKAPARSKRKSPVKR